MESRDPVEQAAARRRRELDQRIEELHARNAQLAATLLDGAASETHAGSSLTQVTRAEELARLAGQRAIEATRRAAAMYLNSATAHERASRMHILLAENGAEDAGQHRQRAREHLQLAAQDRATARAMTGGRRAGPPGHGAGEAGAGDRAGNEADDRAGDGRGSGHE